MKKIRCRLNTDSINQAIKEVELYKRGIEAKTNLFLRRLGAVGIATVESRSAGQNFATSFVVDSIGANHLVGTLMVSGEELMFFEFGTGVHYNDTLSPHPHGARLGMIIGEYGKKQGRNDFWYFDGEKQYGIKAQMPVYMAYVEVLTLFERIAKEVFTV